MDLQNPTNKMSKSADSPKGTVQILEGPAKIAKKFRSAVTDSETEVRFDRQAKPGVSNLLEIFAVASGRSIEDLVAEYRDGGYGTFKTAVAEAVVEMLRPIQERHAELAADPAEVTRILADGASRARAISAPKLAQAKDAVGFLPAG
jgi:tryptophanyl-tRNA synthetase